MYEKLSATVIHYQIFFISDTFTANIQAHRELLYSSPASHMLPPGKRTRKVGWFISLTKYGIAYVLRHCHIYLHGVTHSFHSQEEKQI